MMDPGTPWGEPPEEVAGRVVGHAPSGEIPRDAASPRRLGPSPAPAARGQLRAVLAVEPGPAGRSTPRCTAPWDKGTSWGGRCRRRAAASDVVASRHEAEWQRPGDRVMTRRVVADPEHGDGAEDRGHEQHLERGEPPEAHRERVGPGRAGALDGRALDAWAQIRTVEQRDSQQGYEQRELQQEPVSAYVVPRRREEHRRLAGQRRRRRSPTPR